MTQRVLKTVLAVVLCIGFLTPAFAEEDYSNTDYWIKLCTGDAALTTEQKSSCAAFMQYQSNNSQTLKDRLNEIESNRAEYSENIQKYAAEVAQYQAQADSLNGEIAELNGQIAVKQKEIEELEARIEENQAEIDMGVEKIGSRMVKQQQTMRLNPILDILMGAKTFNDFVRIANGLNNITEYDSRSMDKLAAAIEQMNVDKAQLEEDKKALDESKQVVVDKQNEFLALKYQAQVIEQEYRQKFAELEAEGNRIAANIDAIRKQMEEISTKLNEVTATGGWSHPVPGSVVSAGTWSYDGGGVHLGEDFAASIGTRVAAVGNGVILHSVDGCGYGSLGNMCGAAQGGTYGGGNQVYLLTKINGGLYAVKYLHLLAGSPIAKGTIVYAGDTIGQMGSSGNSTGSHCHIEVFYLGNADQFTKYATNWDGDMAFGCGWGSAALNRLCENGVGAPCRMKPESLFGG